MTLPSPHRIFRTADRILSAFTSRRRAGRIRGVPPYLRTKVIRRVTASRTPV
ncbi:hypothetical protein ACNTMW_11665 [Planosporangium sp. 12N6]|uniref:hypothetical protein n=1 Tax=Planosporangium spinosum TaxID=3402278 RepID=UPI003CEC4ACF